MNDQEPRGSQDWVEDAKTEISGMAKEGINHPWTPPVLTGAAIGAVAGDFLAARPCDWCRLCVLSADQEVTF